MSVKIEITGIINHTSAPKALKHGYVQEIVILKPAGTNQFGEQVGQDNYYKVAIFKASASDFHKRHQLLKAKVKATCYLNGKEYAANNGLAYGLSLTLKDLEFIK